LPAGTTRRRADRRHRSTRGMGSIPGAVIASMILGISEAFAQAYIPQWSAGIFFGVILVVLLFRPEGIMGEKTREDVAT
ncbi:MAG: hypothetical protein VW082_10725, partial [Candidatus Nanopelagicales bacterium]